MNEIIFDVARLIATITGLVVAYYIIPVLKTVVQNHIDENITGFINSCVYAAEQIYNDPKTGTTKKKFVLKAVTDWLNARNIKITDEQLNILIESAVLAMKTETK
jgi:LL-H family phage holin